MNEKNPSASLQIEGPQRMKRKRESESEISEPPAKRDNASYGMEDGYRRQEMNAKNPSASLQIEGPQGMTRKREIESEINEPTAERENASYDMEDGRRQEADRSESCSIQAIVRTGRIARYGSDGNLLKALSGKESDEKLIVDFTGVDPEDPSSVFHLEACDDRDGNVLRYSLGSDNYYLRVYSGGKVMLRKLKDYPTKDKYYFHIEKVSLLVGCPATVQSLSSKEYLASDENGKAFMKPDVGTVRDRQTWFGFHGSYFDHTLNKSEATVQFQQQDLPDGVGESTDPENKVQDNSEKRNSKGKELYLSA